MIARALKELAAVQTGAQNKMPLEQRARAPEQRQHFFARHRSRLTRGAAHDFAAIQGFAGHRNHLNLDLRAFR